MKDCSQVCSPWNLYPSLRVSMICIGVMHPPPSKSAGASHKETSVLMYYCHVGRTKTQVCHANSSVEVHVHFTRMEPNLLHGISRYEHDCLTSARFYLFPLISHDVLPFFIILLFICLQDTHPYASCATYKGNRCFRTNGRLSYERSLGLRCQPRSRS